MDQRNDLDQVQENFLLALLLLCEIVKQAETQISAGLKYDIGSRGVAGNRKKYELSKY